MRPPSRAAALVLATLISAPALGAQVVEPPPIDAGFEDGEAAAYLALTLTPAGALAPSHDYLLGRDAAGTRRLRVHGRLASIDRGPGLGQRTLGATLDMPAGAATLSLTLGWVDVTCDEDLGADFDIALSCGGGLALDARLGRPIVSRPLDGAGTARLVLGIEGAAGYSDVDLLDLEAFDTSLEVTAQSLSAVASLPLALVVRSGTSTIAPRIVPGVGWGRAELGVGGFGEDVSENGVRAMLGAGLAIRFGPRMGLDLGLQRVFATDAETAFGLGLSATF